MAFVLANFVFGQIQTPESYFGFTPGDDRELFNYEESIGYLKTLDETSDRLTMVEAGKSPEGRPMYIAFFSAPENLVKLPRLKEINRELALNPNISAETLAGYIEEGRVFLMAALSMHSTEVGPAQSAPLIAYDLVTTQDPLILERLSNVVYMMIPCHNPDGMDMVVEHYKKYKGTKYEGSSLPRVYHKYIGHDNNRDFVTLSQSDTKTISRIYSTEWYPHIMVEKHQMGSEDPRYFVPPMHDPIAVNVNESLWNWSWVLGSNEMTDMTKAGLAGVSQHYLFDDYWPGSTATCNWLGVIGILSEAASANLATPVYIEPSELEFIGKGLSENKKSINMPLPWGGGWWRLSDIVTYEIESTRSLIKTASLYRRDILEFRNKLCRDEVARGATQPPYYYLIPKDQHDVSELYNMVNLLIEHGVKVYTIKSPFNWKNLSFKTGDFIIPMNQPYRPFIKEVMGAQTYPIRHYTPGGEIIMPYDITSWSLTLNNGISATEITTLPDNAPEMVPAQAPISDDVTIPARTEAAILTVTNNESYQAAFKAKASGLEVRRLSGNSILEGKRFPKGSFIISFGRKQKAEFNEIIMNLNVSPTFTSSSIKADTSPLEIPRIALVESNFHDMDAGWARYIFDTYGLPYTVVKPGEFETTEFSKTFDVVIFPDEHKSILEKGQYQRGDSYIVSDYPPEYTKGIGDEGMKRLMKFLENGGIILSWGHSTELFAGTLKIEHSETEIEEFQLPFRDDAKALAKDGFYSPGSLFKLRLKPDHPLTVGLEPEIGVFSFGSPILSTQIPNFDMDRRVIGDFAETGTLMSGYCDKPELLANRPGMIWLKKGKGQFVLFGFNPQYRASTSASYKLVFNSILLEKLD